MLRWRPPALTTQIPPLEIVNPVNAVNPVSFVIDGAVNAMTLGPITVDGFNLALNGPAIQLADILISPINLDAFSTPPVTAGMLSAGRVNWGKLNAATVMLAGVVVAGMLSAGRVNWGKLNAPTVMLAGVVVAGMLSAGRVNWGKLNAQACSWMHGVPNARPQVPMETLRRSKCPRNCCHSSSVGCRYSSVGRNARRRAMKARCAVMASSG
nr:hypothetical protein [Mycobacterium riyadhense]